MSIRKPLIGFSFFAIVSILVIWVIWSTLQRSVDGPTNDYSATFSDVLGLKAALTVAPLACLVAAVFFLLAARHYRADGGHFAEPAEHAPAHP